MRAEEYLRIATGDIADPARACDAYRELKSHLEQATADVLAQGVEPVTAGQVAMARMGAPESLALALAAAHHRHIPWRHYLAVLPLGCLAIGSVHWGDGWLWTVGQWWLALLVVCLAPSGATLRRWIRALEVDRAAKRQWLRDQPLRPAAISGGVAGFLTGVLLWTLLYLRPSPLALFVIPPVAAMLLLYRLRRVHSAPAMLTACCAALAFPAGCLPLLFDYVGWVNWLFISVTFSVLALAAGWLAQTLQHKGWLSRT